MDDVETKLAKARTQLLLNRRYIFWATVGMYQQLIEKNTPDNPTMATDGEHLYFNRDFVKNLNKDELMFVLAHEAGHCALGHHLRRQARHAFGWNIAADFALNQLLVQTGLTPPKGVLLDDQFKDMSAELIYTKIKQTEGKNTGDFGGCGQVMDSVLVSSKDEAGVKKWEIITRQAAQQAKAQGSLPGAFEYLIEPIKPKVDFHSMLRHLVSTVQEDDYSWARPNRRRIHDDIYLPSLRTESVGDIVIAIDISGSISKDQASKFCGAVNIVLSEFRPKRLHFIQCDAAIQVYEEIPRGELLPEKVKIKGGGGTDMRPIWTFIEEKGLNPVAAIVCSDFYMDTASFGKKQQFPVLWVTCTKDATAPWGITVKLE